MNQIFPLLTLTPRCLLMLLWWWYSSAVSEKYSGRYQRSIEELVSYSFSLAWLLCSSLLLRPKCLCPTSQRQLHNIFCERYTLSCLTPLRCGLLTCVIKAHSFMIWWHYAALMFWCTVASQTPVSFISSHVNTSLAVSLNIKWSPVL